jgi:hypothetical protein
VTDESGRLLRAATGARRTDARSSSSTIAIVARLGGYFIDLPPPVIRIPREHYIVDASSRLFDLNGKIKMEST